MTKHKNNKSTSPKKDEHYRWKVTDTMRADTYNDMLAESMDEVISAVVMSETYPDTKNYENKLKKDK